jgi:hypothetical protein
MDVTDLRPGENWGQAIAEALGRSIGLIDSMSGDRWQDDLASLLGKAGFEPSRRADSEQ